MKKIELANQWLLKLQEAFKLFVVLKERSIWLGEGYGALENRDFSDFSVLKDQRARAAAKPAVHTAFSYATAVFSASAVEVWLHFLFFNSAVALEHATGRPLPLLRGKLADRMRTSVEDLNARSLSDLSEELKTLQFSDLSTAEKLFEEVFGSDCFRKAVPAKELSQFRRSFGDLVGIRNSILHRGGETKKGVFIEVDLDKVKRHNEAATAFATAFSSWARLEFVRRLADVESNDA